MKEPLHEKEGCFRAQLLAAPGTVFPRTRFIARAEASCTRAARETYDAYVQDPKVPCSSRRFRQPGKAELLVRHAVGKRCHPPWVHKDLQAG